MADFGLTHEANYIGHRLYLSDSGGRWSLPPADVERRFVADGGFLQMLIHPVWWAFSGEMVRARAVEPGGAGAARGDPHGDQRTRSA
jgi:hypothetical protein